MLDIPSRIFYDSPLAALAGADAGVRAAGGCLFTRHHDGVVRQRAVRLALEQDVEWCAPFVVALLGDDVIEITSEIGDFIEHRLARAPGVTRGLRRFAASNPDFLALTRARAISYRSEYHRRAHPRAALFPPLRALDRIERLLPSPGPAREPDAR